MNVLRRPVLAVFAGLLLVFGLVVVAGSVSPLIAHASTCTINNSASAPAEVELRNSTASSATTANFSPPDKSLLLVEVSIEYDRNTPTGPTVTVTDSGGNTYTAGPSAYDGAGAGTYQFEHYFATAPGSGHVTAHRSGATGAAMFDVKVRVLTGAAASQAGAATASNHAQSGTSLTKSITPTTSGSDLEASVSVGSNQTLTASGLTTDTHWNDSSDGSATAGGHLKPSSLNPVTIGWTVPSSTIWSLAITEVLPDTSCGGGGGGTLTWSPPACGGADGLTCTTVNITNSNLHPSLASNVDYKLVLPSTPITAGTLEISGGHNVQVIGGEIDLINPCSDSGTFCPAQADGAIYITDPNAGEVYLEGVLIHNTQTAADTGSSCPGGGMSCSTADGIDVNTAPGSAPTIVFQNMRVDGISGCSGGSDHADGLQPYQAGGSQFDIDHFTVTTNCQGFQLDPDLSTSNPPNFTIKNANVDVLQNPYSGNNDRYGWWLTDGCTSGNVSLTNTYEQEPDGSLANNAVWPDPATGSPTNCGATYGSSKWTPSSSVTPQITGFITTGQPAGGDYVPTGAAGIGYVSPGYM